MKHLCLASAIFLGMAAPALSDSTSLDEAIKFADAVCGPVVQPNVYAGEPDLPSARGERSSVRTCRIDAIRSALSSGK